MIATECEETEVIKTQPGHATSHKSKKPRREDCLDYIVTAESVEVGPQESGTCTIRMELTAKREVQLCKLDAVDKENETTLGWWGTIEAENLPTYCKA